MFARTAVFVPKSLNVRHGSFKNVKILNVSATRLPFPSVDAAKTPVKVTLEAGKTYSYCACGLSAKQPFCDGTHKGAGRTMLRPIRFTVDKAGSYIMCRCKSTSTPPLCDGTHKKISQKPSDADKTRFVAFGKSPVYEGVAYRLGYKTKNNGFQ